MYQCSRLFYDVPGTSARFTHLDPQDRSHAPPCQCPPVRVGGHHQGTAFRGGRLPEACGKRVYYPQLQTFREIMLPSLTSWGTLRTYVPHERGGRDGEPAIGSR